MLHKYKAIPVFNVSLALALCTLMGLPLKAIADHPIAGAFNYLERNNWTGTTHYAPNVPAKVGGWARGPSIPYSYEAIVKFDVASLTGILQSAKLRIHVTGGVTGVYSTVTAFDANKGAWSSSTVTYDTFCSAGSPPSCAAWNTALGNVSVNAAQPGWYEIEGSALLSKVQQWVNTPSSNNGLVLSGDFYTHEYYATVDQVELVAGHDSPPSVPYLDWPRSSSVVLNTSASGANVTGTVLNFPILVWLDATNFNFEEAMDNGSDLRFSRRLADGSVIKLPLQIESWDKAGKKALVWVKVDEISGNSPSQAIGMHWGHADPPQDSYVPVFSTDNGFRAVYHLEESPGGVAGGYKDATSNGYHATGIGGMPANSPTPGQMGNAQWFDGVVDYLDLPNLPNAPLATVSIWYKAETLKANAGLLSNGLWSAGIVHFNDNSGTLRANPNAGTAAETPGQVAGTWYLASYTYLRNRSISLYVNGQLVTSGLAPNNDWVGSNLEIGHEYNNYSSGTRYFHGVLDEVRIENVVRSEDWIRLCYENQKTSQSLVSVQRGVFMPLAGGTMFGNIDMGGMILDNAGTVVAKRWKIPVPDYALEPGYQLPSPATVEAYTKKYRHLPDMPSAKEMEADGIDIATMNLRLLKQVEHLHLYLFDQDERLNALEKKRAAAKRPNNSSTRGPRP